MENYNQFDELIKSTIELKKDPKVKEYLLNIKKLWELKDSLKIWLESWNFQEVKKRILKLDQLEIY